MKIMNNCSIWVVGIVFLFGWLLTNGSQTGQSMPLKFSPISGPGQFRPPSSENWRNIQIKDKVVMSLPQNMKPVEMLGDAPWYREAYGNKDIGITVSYGYTSIPDAKLPESLTSCDTTALEHNDPTFTTSAITIDGRTAKLTQNRDGGFIFTSICFAKSRDNLIPLWVAARCRNQRAVDLALEIFRSIKFRT